MIRKLVDFALDDRFIVLVIAFLWIVWGAISFPCHPPLRQIPHQAS